LTIGVQPDVRRRLFGPANAAYWCTPATRPGQKPRFLPVAESSADDRPLKAPQATFSQ
jgi:hypothetical protein